MFLSVSMVLLAMLALSFAQGWLVLPLAGAVAAATMLLSAFSVLTLGCVLFFPNREEELKPELWAAVGLPAAAE